MTQLIALLYLFIDRLGVYLKSLSALVAKLTPVPVATFAAAQAYVSGKNYVIWLVVAADETTLDSSGNPQKVTYYYDGSVLWYPALARADGTVTVAGSDGIGLLPAVADMAGLLATPTVYRPTLIPLTADPANSGNTGFYLKEAGTNGKIHQLATNPIN